MMEDAIPLSGLSFFSAAVDTMADVEMVVSLAEITDAEMTACGLSFFSSAAVAVEITEASAKNPIEHAGCQKFWHPA